MSETSSLSVAALKNLGDKTYEKRKAAAMEILALVRRLREGPDNLEKVGNLISQLTEEFMMSPNANCRKGGLTALAAVAIGLQNDVHVFLSSLLEPTLRCAKDSDSRIKYYAVEALFNITKVGGGHILPYFNRIFECLASISMDRDQDVRTALPPLDRMMKDVVTANENFDAAGFIPILRFYMTVKDPEVQKFLVDWIEHLDSIPSIHVEMLEYLPEFLPGIFDMLSDQPGDPVMMKTAELLFTILTAIKETNIPIDLGAITKIVVFYSKSPIRTTRHIALTWIYEFIVLSGSKMLASTADILNGCLPSISHSDERIKKTALLINDTMRNLSLENPDAISVQLVILAVVAELKVQPLDTKCACLRWVDLLFLKAADRVTPYLDSIFPTIMKTLSDTSDEVVQLALEVLCKICRDESQFSAVLNHLVELLSNDRRFLENRGSMVIRVLGVRLGPEKVYRNLARILAEEQDLEFVEGMIEILIFILLTSSEFSGLRKLLRKSLKDCDAKNLFEELYMSWCHNAVATIALCLLVEAYDHAAMIVNSFGSLTIDINFLMQVDRLIQFLEAPTFVYLRLQLLDPHENIPLLKTLYGLLMILPQGAAYQCLKNRLDSVQVLSQLQRFDIADDKKQKNSKDNTDDAHIQLKHFLGMQHKRQLYEQQRASLVKGDDTIDGGGVKGVVRSNRVTYHKWANIKLLSLLSTIPNEFLCNPSLGLYFGSINATLSHVAIADKLWHTRLTTGGLSGMEHLWSTRDAAAWERAIGDGTFLSIYGEMIASSEIWIRYVEDSLNEKVLSEPFRYVDTRGQTMTGDVAATLDHVFNHATHHRGQITAALTMHAYEMPELDLLYFMSPSA